MMHFSSWAWWGTALAVTCVLRGVPAAAQEPLTYDLEYCLRTALDNATELRVATEQQQAAEAAAEHAGARRWPVIAVNAEASYASEVNEVDLPTVPPRSLRFGDNESYGVTAGVEVPLYTGGTLSATERAYRVDALATVYDGSADSLRVVRDVRAGFYQALGAQAEVDAAQLAVQRLQRHLREVEGRIRAGAATEEARLQAQSRLRSAEQRADAAVEHRSVARLELGRIVGLPGQPIAPRGELVGTLLTEDAGVSAADAVASRPELHALTLRQRASEARGRAVRGSYWPSISAIGQLHYARPGVKVIENEWMDWASAGVQLRWTLWDKGGRTAQARQLDATTRALGHQHEALQRRLVGALAVSRARVQSRRDQVDKAEDRVELDRQRLRLVEGRYAQGLGTETELLDTQDDLAESEADRAAALASLRLAEIDVLYAVAH